MSAINSKVIAKRLSKIQTGEKLDALRSSVVRKVGSITEDIHIWLLSEIKDIEKHRNPTKLNQTLSKIEKQGVRTAAIHMFIQTFCNVKMTDTVKPSKNEESERKTLSDGKDYTVFYKVKNERKELSFFTGRKDGKATYSTPIPYDKATEKGMDEYLTLAAAKPWTEFRPEPTARQFDFDAIPKSVASAIKRAYTEVHQKGSFSAIPNSDFLTDLFKVVLEHYPDQAKDITSAFDGELPKDTPAELSNVIAFPLPKAGTTETPATVNETPRPAKVLKSARK